MISVPYSQAPHPLLGAAVLAAIERAAIAHRGRPWVSQSFTSLDDRASHPSGILHGTPFSVFAKLSPAADAREQFTAELAGLRLLHQGARVPVPVPVASGLAETPAGALLLFEALPERPPEFREPRDWRSIGQVLAALHHAGHQRFGLDGPHGFFGPLPQDNRPVSVNRWADFYWERSRCCGRRWSPGTCRPRWPPGWKRSRSGCPPWPARSRGPRSCMATPSRTTSSVPRRVRS